MNIDMIKFFLIFILAVIYFRSLYIVLCIRLKITNSLYGLFIKDNAKVNRVLLNIFFGNDKYNIPKDYHYFVIRLAPIVSLILVFSIAK